jgi:GTP cyclohydrolase II
VEARQNDGLVNELESQLAAKSKLLKEYQTRPNWLEEYHDLLSNEGVVQISAENRALKIRLDELLEELKAWKSAHEKGLENVVCSVRTSESFENILEEDARIKKLEHVIAAQHEDLKNLMDTVVDLQEENRNLQTLFDEKLGECWETERFQLEKTWKRHAMEWSKDTDRFKSQIKQLQMELETARGERTASTTPQGDIVYQQQIMELQVELENSRHKLAITEEKTKNMAAVMEQNVQRMLSDQIIEFSKRQDRELAVALANERATASATLLVEQGLRTEAENKAKDLADRNKELEMELSAAQSRFSEIEIRSDVVGSLAKEKEFSLDAMAKMADELQQAKTANATLKLKQQNHEREQKVQADMLEKLLNEVANTSLVAVQDRDKLAAQKELVGSLAKEKECALEAVATMEDELQKEKTANATLTAEIVRLSAKEKEHAEDLQRYQHISAGSIFVKNAALNENAALKSQLEVSVKKERARKYVNGFRRIG